MLCDIMLSRGRRWAVHLLSGKRQETPAIYVVFELYFSLS
jgi:hypothetical protein